MIPTWYFIIFDTSEPKSYIILCQNISKLMCTQLGYNLGFFWANLLNFGVETKFFKKYAYIYYYNRRFAGV